MPLVFDGCKKFPYERGGLYIGKSPVLRFPVGYRTERHALTIAGARSGKGAALIIPNLLRWPGSALVIDPKGEAAEATAAHRANMGQAVHVVDPFGSAQVPDELRKRYNPFSALTAETPHIREALNVIADGLVMREDSRASHWDDGGKEVIAGLAAHIISTAPKAAQTLPELRKLLTLDDASFSRVVNQMADNHACDNLPAAAAAKLTRTGNEAAHFLSVASRNTNWLDSAAIAGAMGQSDFDLADLKRKPTTVYLVLPVDMLDEHGRFLRLFVRSAISAMARKLPNGGLKGMPCLFLLDEFAALGYISEIAKAAGLMPGYGLHLWPILQDWGQLVGLYGKEGAETFAGNADVQTFFGNTDQLTLERIAALIGEIRRDKGLLARKRQEDIGRSLMSAREIRNHVRKGRGDVVARRMIAFMPGDAILSVRPAPYFKQWGYRPAVLSSEFAEA